MAALGRYQHTHRAAPFGRGKDRAASSHRGPGPCRARARAVWLRRWQGSLGRATSVPERAENCGRQRSPVDSANGPRSGLGQVDPLRETTF